MAQPPPAYSWLIITVRRMCISQNRPTCWPVQCLHKLVQAGQPLAGHFLGPFGKSWVQVLHEVLTELCVVSTVSALAETSCLILGLTSLSSPVGVASSAPGIEGIRVNTTLLYKRMGLSTEYAGEAARGVTSPGGVETVVAMDNSLFARCSPAAFAFGVEWSLGAIRARDRVWYGCVDIA
jgi:hypothetical protein